MNERLVIDTGPLIAFGKMEALELIANLPFDFICPIQVRNEIFAGAAKGHSVLFPDWVDVIELTTRLSPLTLASLDAGEAAVIELALQEEISLVCLDELKGRRAAAASGLKVIGSLGVIGKAKTLGIVRSVRPFIERAQNSGIYYEPKLIDSFLNALGE